MNHYRCYYYNLATILPVLVAMNITAMDNYSSEMRVSIEDTSSHVQLEQPITTAPARSEDLPALCTPSIPHQGSFDAEKSPLCINCSPQQLPAKWSHFLSQMIALGFGGYIGYHIYDISSDPDNILLPVVVGAMALWEAYDSVHPFLKAIAASHYHKQPYNTPCSSKCTKADCKHIDITCHKVYNTPHNYVKEGIKNTFGALSKYFLVKYFFRTKCIDLCNLAFIAGHYVGYWASQPFTTFYDLCVETFVTQ